MDNYELEKIIEETNAMLNRKGLDSQFFRSIGVTPINISGIKGYFTSSSSPQMNHVGLAELEDSNVESVIQKTVDLFCKEKKSFTWVVGPNSKPDDLVSHLVKHGFNLIDEISEYGMVMSTADVIYKSENAIVVKEVPLENLENSADVIAESFGQGMSPEIANTIIQMAKLLNATDRYKNKIKAYLAIDSESGKVVGFSLMEMDTEEKYAILSGAAVHPSYRGKGIYRNMIWKRQQDARENGIEYMIIHAVKNTSAPVCEKVGFRKVCELNLYSYIVEE